MKKLLVLLSIILTFSGNPTASGTRFEFNDVSDNDWFKENVHTLVNMNVVDGYPDGSFRPGQDINADAFIKMAVTALGYTDIENGSPYWASTYIDKAMELNLVLEDEFSGYGRPVTRYEMARIIVRALEEDYEGNLQEYARLITDYHLIEDIYKDYVVKAYCKGILTGYKDGSFRGERTATRAEAAAIIHRLIDDAARAVPELPGAAPTHKPIPTPAPPENGETVEYLSQEEVERLKQYEDNTGAGLVYDVGTKKMISFYKTNDKFITDRGYNRAVTAVYIATTHMNTANNVDYKIYDKKTYKDELRKSIDPQIFDLYAQDWLDNINNYKIGVEGQFYSHPSLVYVSHEGRLRVRGLIKYIVHSCTDVEHFFGASIPLGKWIQEDCEIELYSMGDLGPYYRKLYTISTVPRDINQGN